MSSAGAYWLGVATIPALMGMLVFGWIASVEVRRRWRRWRSQR
jgi:hypothetical protein